MAGLTEHGFTIKRLHEVIADAKARAQPIFQDLVPPGDIVDTSDSTTIGRLIGLKSPAIADLWEAAQQVYLAFDPNSATGVALDNLVQYGGLTRRPATATTATVVVWGDENTDILGFVNTVRATDNTLYDLTQSVSLKRDRNIGFRLKINNVVSGESYGFVLNTSNVTLTITKVADSSDTKASIISSLQSQLAFHTFLTTSSTVDTLQVECVDIFEYIGVVPNNLIIDKIKGRTEVRSQTLGRKEQAAHTINQIATPLLGWDSVDNPFPAISGSERETDEELRTRFRNSKFLRSQNISDSLYSALLDLDGVEYVSIYENESGTYDHVHDLPGHSFKAVVMGGVPKDIAQVIWRNKPLGIGAEGNTSEWIFDSQGFQREIRFSRPSQKRIYIHMELETFNGFPGDGDAQIKSALVEYFKNTFKIGQEVIYSRLFTPINSVPGHQVNSLFIGTTPSPTGTSNIPVGYSEIASLNSEDIVVDIV